MLKIAIQYEMTLQDQFWPGDERSLKLIEALGGVYWESGDLEKARDVYVELLENSTTILGGTSDLTVHIATKLRAVRDKLVCGRSATERAASASATPKQNVLLLSDPSQPPPGYSETQYQDSEYESEEYRLREIADQMKAEFGERDGDTFEAIANLGNFYEKNKKFGAAISQFEQLWRGLATPETMARFSQVGDTMA